MCVRVCSNYHTQPTSRPMELFKVRVLLKDEVEVLRNQMCTTLSWKEALSLSLSLSIIPIYPCVHYSHLVV